MRPTGDLQRRLRDLLREPGDGDALQPLLRDAQRRQIMDAAHLTDQLDLYERFEYKPMPFTQAEVMAAQ